MPCQPFSANLLKSRAWVLNLFAFLLLIFSPLLALVLLASPPSDRRFQFRLGHSCLQDAHNTHQLFWLPFFRDLLIVASLAAVDQCISTSGLWPQTEHRPRVCERHFLPYQGKVGGIRLVRWYVSIPLCWPALSFRSLACWIGSAIVCQLVSPWMKGVFLLNKLFFLEGAGRASWSELAAAQPVWRLAVALVFYLQEPLLRPLLRQRKEVALRIVTIFWLIL